MTRKCLFFFFLALKSISCDLSEDYNWNQNSSTQFNRKFGNIGYDYGWSGTNSIYDSGIIISGTQQIELNGQRDLWAIKTDDRGQTLWDFSFGGNNNEEGYDVLSTTDGAYLFVGYTWSFGNEQQIYVIKTDLNGKLIWEKNYGSIMWEVGNSIIELKNGDYAIAGFSNSPGISSGNTDMVLLKIDSNGNQKALYSYGNQSFPNHEWANDLIELYDESIIMVGSRDRYNEGSKNILIIKINKNGKILWEKEILSEKNTNEVSYSISKNKTGGIYVTSSISEDETKNNYYPQIMKIDSFGNIDWVRNFESNSREYHQFRSSITKNGGLILVGSSIANSPLGSKSDAFITRLDSNGSMVWTKAYGTEDHDDWGWSIFEREDESIIMIGSTKSYGASLFDVFLIGVNANGAGY